MKRRKWHWLDGMQIVLMLAVIAASILLILDWKRWEICFSIVFGLAAILFLLLMIGSLVEDRRKSRFGMAAIYLIIMTLMLGLFIGSALTIGLV